MSVTRSTSEIIEHKGLIRAISNGHAEVSLFDVSGCASCAIKSACNTFSADEAQQEKIVAVPVKTNSFHVGEIVQVEMDYSQGMLALFWAYIFPLFLLLAGIIIPLENGLNELRASLIALGILPVYYLLLLMFRSFFSKKFQFRIKKT